MSVPNLYKILSDVLSSFFAPRELIRVRDVSVSANTPVLPSNVKPLRYPCILRIYVVPSGFSTSPRLAVRRVYPDGSVSDEYMFEGAGLLNDSAYLFDVVVSEGEEINIVLDQDGVLKKLVLIEYYVMTG